MKKYIGVDIGGTKCSVVAADEDLKILAKEKFPTGNKDGAIAKIISVITEYSKDSDVMSVGISCGGPLDDVRGVILSPPNLPGWDEVRIVELVSNAAGAPAFIRNDADACAFAEWKFGAGKGVENMVFLTFGTGMGAGLILNGRLYRGACGMAGEVGHIRLENDGPVGYGKAGSFEGFCSGGGIKRTAEKVINEKLSKGETVTFCRSAEEIDSIDARRLSELAKDGDAAALEIFETCGEKLGLALSILIDVLNPEMIVIGSIYARCGELMENRMRRVIEEEALGASVNACRIVPAALGDEIGDYAALAVAKYADEMR